MRIIFADLVLRTKVGPYIQKGVVTLDLPIRYMQHDKFVFGRFMHEKYSVDLNAFIYKGEFPEILEVKKLIDLGESFIPDEQILNSITIPDEAQIKAAPKPDRKTKRK